MSTLDQLAAATNKTVDAQAVLQLVGAVDEESLLRLCDMVVDRDTAGALVFIEELAEQGQDLGRLVNDLLEHLRHLLLVQHMGHVPESLPVTEETKELLRQQANQLPEPTVLRLIDLLAVAVDDMRQGGDPRLPLELALVKVTRPQADLSRESLAHRVELLESRPPPRSRRRRDEVIPHSPAPSPTSAPTAPAPEAPTAEGPDLALEQVADAWQRTIVEAVRGRSISVASLLAEATPTELAGDTLTVEFPPGNDFHRKQFDEPKNIGLLREALYEVTGRRLAVVLEAGEAEAADRGGRGADLRGELDLVAQGHARCPRSRRGGRHQMSFDMNKMLREAQRMQAELAKVQEEAANEIVEASAGGGMVTVKANGAGEVVSITIDPRAIDPDDPELLADMILAAVNEALRSARGLMESKMSGLIPGDLGGLGGLMPGS